MAPKKQPSPPKDFLYRFDVWLSLNDKNGIKIDRRKFLELEVELYGQFGGLTRTPIAGNPIYEGYWKDPDTKSPARDLNTIYTVLAAADASSYNFFIKNKRKWKSQFGQKAILITLHMIEVL